MSRATDPHDYTDARGRNLCDTCDKWQGFASHREAATLDRIAPDGLREARRSAVERGEWPPAVSDGLSIPCVDCGLVPAFDYVVTDEFWDRWAPGERGVVCLPCLDKRSGGAGLVDALCEVQWIGTGHTVVLAPTLRFAILNRDTGSARRDTINGDVDAIAAEYDRLPREPSL